MNAPTEQQLRDPAWWFNALSARYSYNKATGEPRNKKGEVVGTPNAQGYLRVNCRINWKRYDFLAHRVAFLLATGRWPNATDHINGVRDDNRWGNLREVDHETNMRNVRLRKTNKTGVTGVHRRGGGLFRAAIGSGEDRENLGSFDDFFQAVCARKSAEVRCGYHENHGRHHGY